MRSRRLLAYVKGSARPLNLLGFSACAGLLAYAYYLQFAAGLEPCPLCIFQRIGIMAVGIVFLIAFIHNPRTAGLRIYGALIGVFALAGAAVSSRHVWLQHLPADRVPECGPSLEYMLEVLPLSDTLRMVMTGSGECADVSWTFAGLSLPAWTLVWFALLGLMGILNNSYRRH